MKRIIFTVTNDLSYDQRMIRICDSLIKAGYQVTIIGTKNRRSLPLLQKQYQQIRLSPFFTKGFGFYTVFNIRLFFQLLFTPAACICAIDLDTILPVWFIGKLRKQKIVYDAHEYFSQQKEVVTRPSIYKIWHWIEKKFVPKFTDGYTVSDKIALAFKELYDVNYEVIRNMPLLKTSPLVFQGGEKIILYQGSVNEARGLEFLIPAMKEVEAQLVIYGDGNFMQQAQKLIILNNLAEKVLLKGKISPAALDQLPFTAYMGINLVENNGFNQYYSLANKFFDYIGMGIPQITMNFPEYKKINDEYNIAVLINDLQIKTIVTAIQSLLQNEDEYKRMQQHCLTAREILNWQKEEIKLISFYERLLNK